MEINIFQAKEETEEDKAHHPLEDAQTILGSIDFRILNAAKQAYLDIKQTDEQYDADFDLYHRMVPTWQGLLQLVEHEGDFEAFTKEQLPNLQALIDGFMVYYDVVHVLIDHHDDEEEARKLFAEYPELHEAIPHEYHNTKQTLEVILEVVRDYLWQLEHFSEKYKEAIGEAIAMIEAKPA